MFASSTCSALYFALKPKREHDNASDIDEHIREKVINISTDKQKNAQSSRSLAAPLPVYFHLIISGYYGHPWPAISTRR